MELMLQTFKTFNMSDFAFIIVNSKTLRSQKMLAELRSRVSFPVYQETVEDVWNIMGGGKDDMYIYDRCGKLTHYIPFPLSIIHEDRPLVFTSLISTYFGNPCGLICDENNDTYQFEATRKSLGGLSVDTTHDALHESGKTETIIDEVMAVTEATHIQLNTNELDQFINESLTEYDFYIDLQSANISLSNDSFSNNTDGEEINMLQNILYGISDINVFGNNETLLAILNEKIQDTVKINKSTSENYTVPNETESSTNSKNLSSQNSRSDTIFIEDNDEHRPPRDGCIQTDRKVCVHWTKSRQKAAQRCCSYFANHESHGIASENHLGYCQNFTKKRCKKLKTIIKCCSEFVTYSENRSALDKAIRSDM